MKRPAAGSFCVEFDTTRLVFGSNEIDRLGELVAELGCRRVLLVTDAGLRAAGHVDRAVAALQAEEIAVAVFDDVTVNPNTRHVADGVSRASEHVADGLIGLGGGSPLDCAKAINFVLTGGGQMEDYWGSGKATEPMLPSIGVPTTAGTGSEAQSYALISQEGSGVKMACGDRKAKFRTVILDPALAATVPVEVARLSGIDAVSHVMESYVSLRANPISRMLATEAWRLLDRSLDTVLAGRGDEETWGDMLLGAHLAGASIEHSMLGAAHACANPLTQRFNLIHGVAVGLMLPWVMRFNEQVAADLYLNLHRAASVSNDGALLDRVERLRSGAGLQRGLRDYGIPQDCLHELAEEAARQWTAGFNPRPVGRAELVELYEAAY